MKRSVTYFLVFYILYAIAVSLYLLSTKAGYVPSSYLGTAADPHTFMTDRQIIESHQISMIYDFNFFLITPVSLALPLFLMPASVRIMNWVKQLTRKTVLQTVVYLFLFLLLLTLIFLPLDVLFFYINRSYQLSSEPISLWFLDYTKTFAINYVTNVVVVLVVFKLIQKSPKRWWLYTWLLSIPAIIFSTLITPIVLDPVFNRFTPMPAGHQRQEIVALAHKAGIPNAEIFVVDKSKQTNEMNAYVTGIGTSARIVVWDTTLKHMRDDELLFVLGHEMGHYVHKDVYKSVALEVVGSFFLCLLCFWGYRKLFVRLQSRWVITNPYDVAAFPILLFVFNVLLLASAPITSYCSRQVEHQADAFGIALTNNPRAAVSAFQKLDVSSLSEVTPPLIIHLIEGDHPTMFERITFVENYHG